MTLKSSLALLLVLALAWIGWDTSVRSAPPHRAEWLQAQDTRVRVLRAGPARAGDTTLVLLHGFSESLLTWRFVLDRVAREHPVVALDLPGFGMSEKPEGRYDLEGMVGRLEDFLARNTSGPLVLVGHSMGGELATALALDNPERIKGLILIAPAGLGVTSALGDSGSRARAVAAWATAALAFVLPIHDPAWLEESDSGAVYELTGDSAYARVTREVIERFDFGALAGRYGEVRQPVLLIWGRQDPTIPFELGEQMAAQLPCRRFVPLSSTLHRPHQTQPDTVAAEMLRFLEELEALRSRC